jgi:hypothetical protein
MVRPDEACAGVMLRVSLSVRAAAAPRTHAFLFSRLAKMRRLRGQLRKKKL